ncbi:hypothetical protein CLAFUW4_03866 [Fulvia fulva]|uniref:Sacsin/Nov domain-containing protein n=1 Tax=Passalora fulva TaxID=5499 RepID=A0A9Q8LBK6_PASFU|nr:uncharacterized protein CLAFUR5_03838 [Fulvia fulva]KAK4633280.1 hypothetical protein CLAFUR0_03853 [Fulvia fulva]UJO13748.1 hypothetical protein CLAFUR5_03838 [Fulvia fulva]WPV10747.1 hypothetical protein CLAFUW4_03866 [Fulvia fulva]WPV26621.1 hypothetical protein CLAFUW7_03858 [Fulvia fulva]
MAASQNLARLREQTMGSLEDEEAVTVNTRALIDKVLARYSGEWTTLRELIQNAADAQASKVTIRFETLPSATVPLPQTQDPSELLKHTLLHHSLNTLMVSNDGELFQETDWQRLKRIAEGNPDETKIGAFGVGFYSVFADCESPFVSSGDQSMAFYWKKDSLFTRRGKMTEAQKGTTFLLDYRNQTTPVPQLLSLCQFLATSLTFVGLQNIELWLDDWNVLNLSKKMAPGAQVKIPKEVKPQTQGGLMKIVDVEYQNAQIDAKWMNVVGWNRTSQATSTQALAAQSQTDVGGLSLRSFFGKFTGASATNTVRQKAQKEEEVLQQAILEDLAGCSQSTVFVRMSTVNVQTYVSKQLATELERATKKPPPKHTRISILTSSFDETTASSSTSSGSSAIKAGEIFASVQPTKNGKIFIGFPTAQTTGLLAHISAPSVIPTVERESIDLNARYVRDWNIEMLRVAGIACRIAYTGEMAELKNRLDRTAAGNGRKKIAKEDVDAVMTAAVHTYKQYSFAESTPAMKVGHYIEEAFWTCTKDGSIDVLSTRGVLSSSQVRVATEDLSFVDGIPVVPDELMDKALAFISKLRDYGLLSDITTKDIKAELERQALSEKQVTELIKWACEKVSQQEMDAGGVQLLFDGTVASVSEEFLPTSPSPVIQLGSIETYINSARIPVDLPSPPTTILFRLTKGVTPGQLSSLGWDELQIVPWLRWIVESNGQGFPAGQSLTTSAAIASQVLPVVSRSWDGLSQSSKQTVQDLLTPRTVIPTKLGMKKPPQAYFGNVRLFDDLPTITGLQGTKEKFLSSLGVRKTVELTVVFDRLMAKSITPSATEEGKWSHVDLVKYLVSVKDDIPKEDMQRLRQTTICPAETQSGDQSDKGKLYRLADLYEPNDAIRKLGLPILQWQGQFRANTPEGRFLRVLGLQPYPTVPVLVDILSRAPMNSELQQSAVNYWIMNAFHHDYHKFPVGEIDKAFLPVMPFAGESSNKVAKPRQCYANPRAGVLRFYTLREDLQPHHTLFGVAMDPPIDTAAERLLKAPPASFGSAQTLFSYFAGRLQEIGPSGNLAERIGNSPIVPIVTGSAKASTVRYVTPRACFLGDSQSYGDIFDFVDFGHEANTLLLRVGSKHEPSAVEIAGMLVRQPTRLLETLGQEKYLQLLRKIAESAAALKKDKILWQKLKAAPCLLAERQVAANGSFEKPDYDDDDDAKILEYSLARAPEMVIVDDFQTYRLFSATLMTCPQDEALENLYLALETPLLSKLSDNDQRMGQLLNDQSAASKLHKLLVERCRLFLHDHPSDSVRHDAKWLEQNMTVKVTEFLQTTHQLKGYKMSFVEKKTALLHRDTKKDATLYVTGRFDLYEVSKAIMAVLLKRPRQQDLLALETILESDLGRLKRKGYNVDRILRAKAAESRLAESERRKRDEEQKRAQEAEAASMPMPSQALVARNNPNASPQPDASTQQATPEKTLSMPGSFDSPEARPASRGKKSAGGLFSSIRNQLGMSSSGQAAQQMQSLLGQNGSSAPPPYSPQDPSKSIVTPGTERVTSPQDLQANLQSAIKSTREYNDSSLFSTPDTKQIKESPSYCDSKPGHDIVYITDTSNSLKLYLSRSHADPRAFVQAHEQPLVQFAAVLIAVAQIFDLRPQTINIYHDEAGASIAFNSNGSIFCNLRYFMQLHMGQMPTSEGKQDAMAYWFVTLCHELAHNLVSQHDSQHSYYTESFMAHYFRRMMWLAGQVNAQDRSSSG